jgi:hypothetical protein
VRAGTRHPPASDSAQRARFRALLAAFLSCLRRNGVTIPPPSAAAEGPLASLKALHTSSPQYKQAAAKCRSVLRVRR